MPISDYKLKKEHFYQVFSVARKAFIRYFKTERRAWKS